MNPNEPALQPSPWRPLNALRRVALGTLLVASSSLALSPFTIKLTGNSASKSISVVSSNGNWDSLVVSHREPSALSEALVGLSTTRSGLKVTGSALMTGVNNTQSLTIPEAGVYWVYAKRATAANASPDSVWAAGRVEFAPEEGRLTTWYDVTRKALYIRFVVPSSLSLSSKVVIDVTDSAEKSDPVPVVKPPTVIFSDLVSALPTSQSIVRTTPTGAIVAWIHVQRTKAPDSVNVVFPAAVAGGKPILLHASCPIRDPNLEGTAHLLERIQSEKNNPLVKASTTAYTVANQLHFWSALVDSVPTWGGHSELLRALLTKKKGTATSWSDAVAALTPQTLSDTLKASMNRPVIARNTQQNLTGPVYYGAYTRATLDNDLHFPLGEGELLQILWQGSIELYYMEPATTTGQPGLLTKLALPAPQTGTTPPHPYLTTKQLILAQGSPLLAKIQDSGLWVKGVEVEGSAELGLALGLNRIYTVAGATLGVPQASNVDGLDLGERTALQMLPFQWSVLDNSVGYRQLIDTMLITESESQKIAIRTPGNWTAIRYPDFTKLDDEGEPNEVVFQSPDSAGIVTYREYPVVLSQSQGNDKLTISNLSVIQIPKFVESTCNTLAQISSSIVCEEKDVDRIFEMRGPLDLTGGMSAISTSQTASTSGSIGGLLDGIHEKIVQYFGKSKKDPQIAKTQQIPFEITLVRNSMYASERMLRFPDGADALYLLGRGYYRVTFGKTVQVVKLAVKSGSGDWVRGLINAKEVDGLVELSDKGVFVPKCGATDFCTIDAKVYLKGGVVRPYKIKIVTGERYARILNSDWRNAVAPVAGKVPNNLVANDLDDFEKFVNTGYAKLDNFGMDNKLKIALEATRRAGDESNKYMLRMKKIYPGCYSGDRLVPELGSCTSGGDFAKGKLDMEFGGAVMGFNGKVGYVGLSGKAGSVSFDYKDLPLLSVLYAAVHSHPPMINQNGFSASVRKHVYNNSIEAGKGDYNQFANIAVMMPSFVQEQATAFLAPPKLTGYPKSTGDFLGVKMKDLIKFRSKWNWDSTKVFTPGCESNQMTDDWRVLLYPIFVTGKNAGKISLDNMDDDAARLLPCLQL